MKQSPRSHIYQHNFIGLLKKPVGHGLANTLSSQLPYLIAKAGKMLDVHAGEYINAGIKKDLNVLPTFLSRRTRRIRVGQIVHDTHVRAPPQHGINVKFLTYATAVTHAHERDALQVP